MCGRVVDSALTLGVLMHAFGWPADDYDRLAAGSLAGHVIECAAQATGGLFTDWRDVPGWDDMGAPIATCSDDGSFIVSKPAGTGGLVTRATVAEQIVYEIGDPAAYVLPDVICDFTGVRLEDLGDDRVRVSAARGRAPSATYKVSATYLDGYRIAATMLIAGGDAAARAERAGHAILARAERIATARGFAPFAETSVEVAGGGAIVGLPELGGAAREAVLKLAARHAERAPLEVLAREIAPAGCAMAQGFTGLIGGRPKATPVIRLFSFLIDKRVVEPLVELDGEVVPIEAGGRAATATDAVAARERAVRSERPAARERPVPDASDRHRTVTLRAIAWGRSGDKGDACNIGIIARHPAFATLIAEQFTAERVAARFAYVAARSRDALRAAGVRRVQLRARERARRRRDRVAALRPARQDVRADPARRTGHRPRRVAGWRRPPEPCAPRRCARDGGTDAMTIETLRLLRNILLRSFVVAVVIDALQIIVTLLAWKFWISLASGLWHTDEQHLSSVALAYFTATKFVLVFVFLAPAIAIHWTIKNELARKRSA